MRFKLKGKTRTCSETIKCPSASDIFRLVFSPRLHELPLYDSAGLDPTAELVLWISLS